MSDFFYFFAYGSSMNPVTLMPRVRSSSAAGIGQLVGYCPSFHKRAGSAGEEYAVLNAYETGVETDEVMGVVYRIAATDRDALDEIECAGAGCRRVVGDVDLGGKTLRASFYVAQPDWIDPSLKPYDWYLALLSSGARMHGLPMAYQRMLRRVKTVPDPDRHRADEYFQLARKGETLIPFPRKAVDR